MRTSGDALPPLILICRVGRKRSMHRMVKHSAAIMHYIISHGRVLRCCFMWVCARGVLLSLTISLVISTNWGAFVSSRSAAAAAALESASSNGLKDTSQAACERGRIL